MRHKTCKSCMWWWDLYDTGERMCYRRQSPFFHKQTKAGCVKHEDSFEERKLVNNKYYLRNGGTKRD